MRLNQYLSRCGLGSRRSVEEIITEERIVINQKIIIDPAFKVDPESDIVYCDGSRVSLPVKFTYVLLNKPIDYITSKNDPEHKKNIYQLLPDNLQHLGYAGRLDINSRGLVLLSDDGDFIQKVNSPKSKIPKYYRVKFKGEIVDWPKLAGIMKKGVRDDGELLKVHEVNLVDHNLMTICLVEGRKNHIRRILSQLRLTVKDLYRYGIGHLVQGDLNLTEQKHTTINPESISQGPFPSFAIGRSEQLAILKKLEKKNKFKKRQNAGSNSKPGRRSKSAVKRVVKSTIISGSGKRFDKTQTTTNRSKSGPIRQHKGRNNT